MKSVAERLVWARTVGGLTQRRLCLLAGLSNRHVCSLESPRGRKGALHGNMREGTVTALARVLGVPVSWLAYGEGARPDETKIKEAVRSAEEELQAKHLPEHREAS